MKKIIGLMVAMTLTGCLEKEGTFKGCPAGLELVNNRCEKPSNPPVDAVYYDLGLRGSEGGSVEVSFGDSSVTCGEDCEEIVPVLKDTSGVATASPNESHSFSQWLNWDDQPSTICVANPCIVIVNQSFYIKPQFSETPVEPSGDSMLFVAQVGSQGFQLWKTNGTAEGTVLVKDPNSNENANGILPYYGMSVIDNVLYFTAGITSALMQTLEDYELWSSDGTTEGTALYKEINPEMWEPNRGYSSMPYGMIKKDGKIVMAGTNTSSMGQEFLLLDSDRNVQAINLSEGTSYNAEESTLSNGVFSDRVLLPNGNLIFRGNQWSNDPYYMYQGGQYEYSYNRPKLFVANAGEDAPHLMFTSVEQYDCSQHSGDEYSCMNKQFCQSNNDPYEECMMYDPDTGECTEYYYYDVHTCAGTAKITEDSEIEQIISAEGAPVALYVRKTIGNYDFLNGFTYYFEVYSTDGVTNQLLYQSDNEYAISSMFFKNKESQVWFKNQMYFVRDIPLEDGGSTYQLVRTRLPDAGLDVVYENVQQYVKVNENLLLVNLENSEQSSYGLYTFDGETSNLIEDNVNGSIFLDAGSRIYFRVYSNDTSYLGYLDKETLEVTTVKEVGINKFLGVVNGKVIFAGYSQGAGYEPWVTDGTEAGTMMLKDVHEGSSDSLAGYTSSGVITSQ